MAPVEVEVREVWENNIEYEFSLIQRAVKNYPFVSIDTEFPGTIVHPNLQKPVKFADLTPSYSYFLLRCNVDALKIIQLGLTLSDPFGNLPNFGTKSCYIWEFNFKDFDVDKDLQNQDSIQLLKRQGIDFLKNREKGVGSDHFARLFSKTFAFTPTSSLAWVTFHSAYDFGFMIKVLSGAKLPVELNDFMRLLGFYFGLNVFDIKHLMKLTGFCGGLDKIAKSVGVDRVAGRSHQAGSDSLLTMQTFLKLRDMYYHGENMKVFNSFLCIPYGLNIEKNYFQCAPYGVNLERVHVVC